MPEPQPSDWRLCVAPMLEWTDRHCRWFHRLLTRRTRLYTEMVSTGALLHGERARYLDFDAAEHPLALQLGGSEPAELAQCARLAERWGYDEVNLNCGCPSPRVQRGAFGACLMAEPARVADCVRAMREATTLPVSVKHRIGLGRDESYAFVRDFVGTVAERGGCRVFVVHARNAWLEGLSPKENRELPPLRHELVGRLKCDFPALTIVANGGLADDEAIARTLARVDGAMVGRHAYHQPWAMTRWDARFFGEASRALDRDEVEARMVGYLTRLAARGEPWHQAARPMIHLRHGQSGARRWRQVWADARLHGRAPAEVSALARAALAPHNAAARPDAAVLEGGGEGFSARPLQRMNAQDTKTTPLLGIIGGSGLYDLPGLTETRWVSVGTPWGAPSDQIFLGRLGEARLAFLPRHGRGHGIPPSEVNYRANIAALKMLGATDLLSLSAVGGLRADLPPGTFVVVDQFIDRTFARDKSFFGRGLVAHVSMAHPVCARLGAQVAATLAAQGVPHVRGGTYLTMEGPQFSTEAESRLYRSWNCDVIGMTNMPEAKLAREAELCYASVAMVTDFDCWHPEHDAVTVDAIIRVLLANAQAAKGMVRQLAAAVAADAAAARCACRHALDHALITAPEARDPEMVRRLHPIAGRVLPLPADVPPPADESPPADAAAPAP
ncbi:MAG: hypothetical protein AMXMBFR66_26830 [Pseudomonadota bacterium]